MSSFFIPTVSTDARFLRASVVRAPGVTFDGRFEKRLFRGDEAPPAGLVCVAAGTVAPDWIGNSRRLPIVSERLALAMKNAGLKGVDFYPATVETPGGKPLAYAGLIARGRAMLHVERSGSAFELQTGLHVTAPLAVGAFVVEPESWDGSDLFIVAEYPLQAIFSEKAAAVINALGPVGFALEPAETYRPS